MPAGAATTTRAARLLGPDLIVRNQTQALTCPMYASGALVAPTLAGSTISILKPSGAALVDEAAITSVAGSIASYTLSSALVPTTESLGVRWQVVWSLVFATGITPEIIRNDAALIRYECRSTVTDADLYRRVSSLDPSGSAPITSLTTFQDKIDLARGMVVRRMIQEGQRPDLVTSPSSLHDAQVALTLSLIFEDLATRLEGAYLDMANRFRDEYRDLWRSMTYGVDRDNDGNEDPKRKGNGTGGTWLGGYGWL